MTIGIFVSGAFALLAALVVFFGTAQFFERTERYIMFFDESVNGLNVGSAVKFKGVPIGKVTRIMIRAENQPLESSAIPVIVELDQGRLQRELNVGQDVFEEEAFARHIASGLRARLNTESFITGLLFIELDFVESPREPEFVQETMVYREIPTVPSTVQAITQRAMEAIAAFSEVDIRDTIETIQETIRLTRLRMEQLDVPRLVESYADAADLLRGHLRAVDVPQTMDRLNKTLDQVSRLMDSLEEETVVVSDEVSETLAQATAVFSKAAITLDNLNSAVGPDSRLIFEMESTLQSIGRTADSLRSLADFIERNPNAFLRGRAIGDSP